jgi:hypothetical protein
MTSGKRRTEPAEVQFPMNNIRTWLLLILVALVAVGVWLYASELQRQANMRAAVHAAAVAAERAERTKHIEKLQQDVEGSKKLLAKYCGPTSKERVCPTVKYRIAEDETQLEAEKTALKNWETAQ